MANMGRARKACLPSFIPQEFSGFADMERARETWLALGIFT
jgi:hypothetical protein